MTVGVGYLLRPRWRRARNALARAGRRQLWVWGLFGGLTLAFWVGILALAIWVLAEFHQVEVFGPYLVRKLLQMMMLSFFGLLVFSNVVSGISTYFLSDDMHLLKALPVPFRTLFYARFVEAALASSWMVAVFALPVLIAYGVVHAAGAGYYALLPVVLLAFLATPAGMGIALAYLLIQVFPARRTQEILAAVGLVFGVTLLVALRALRPEQLVSADSFPSMADFLAAVRTPAAPWLPSTWATDVLLRALGQDAPLAGPSLAALVTTGAASAVLCRWLVSPGYDQAFTKAQEARSPRLARLRVVDGLIRLATLPLPGSMRALARKDGRVFLRDAGQWTQIFLVASLIVIYLFNVHILPVDAIPSFRLENLVAFLNIGLAGFVLAALSARFNFTAVSGEGRAFWILHASPMGAERFLASKFVFGAGPLVALGEVLVIATDWMLGASPLVTALGVVTIFGLALGVTGLGVGMGAVFPDFKADNASRVAASPGAILYMVVAAGFIACVLFLQATPVALYLTAQYRHQTMTPFAVGLSAVMVIASVALTVTAVVLPLRRGAQVLWGEAESGGD